MVKKKKKRKEVQQVTYTAFSGGGEVNTFNPIAKVFRGKAAPLGL